MEKITRKDQIVVKGSKLNHPLMVEHVESVRFLGEDGKECHYPMR
jgi:hypothetical protein